MTIEQKFRVIVEILNNFFIDGGICTEDYMLATLRAINSVATIEEAET